MLAEEENKARHRRVIEEVFNQGDLSVVPELFAENYVSHGPTGADSDEAKGLEGFRRLVMSLRSAAPDLRATIEDIIAEGDRTVLRIVWRGTHKGMFNGIPPTGKTIVMDQIVMARWENGKEVEAWGVSDRLRALQQIGV